MLTKMASPMASFLSGRSREVASAEVSFCYVFVFFSGGYISTKGEKMVVSVGCLGIPGIPRK